MLGTAQSIAIARIIPASGQLLIQTFVQAEAEPTWLMVFGGIPDSIGRASFAPIELWQLSPAFSAEFCHPALPMDLGSSRAHHTNRPWSP